MMRCEMSSPRLLLAIWLLLAALMAGPAIAISKLKLINSWKSLDFAFPNEGARQAAIDSQNYIPGNPVPIDVEAYFRESSKKPLIFVTIPRFQKGVPVTLGFISDHRNANGESLIAPYPSWEMQKPGDNCRGLTSVYRVTIDVCNRMWVLDTGKIEDKQVCPPKILAFNLITNSLIRYYEFPSSQYTAGISLFVTPVVDIRIHDGFCDDTFVYIADVTGFGLIVYDHKNSDSWRITNKLFYPYPQYGTFEINNESFDLMDGILGLALGPINLLDGDRILYFHSLASRTESWVPTSIIRNSTIFRDNAEASPRSFKAFSRERPSQSAAQVMDRHGVSFYGLMSDVAIGCWNSRNSREFSGNSVDKLVTDKETLQFISGIKIIPSKDGDQLWIMSISFQKFMTGSMKPTETNFRIQGAVVHELVRGSKCQVIENQQTTNWSSGISFH